MPPQHAGPRHGPNDGLGPHTSSRCSLGVPTPGARHTVTVDDTEVDGAVEAQDARIPAFLSPDRLKEEGKKHSILPKYHERKRVS